MKIKHAVVYPLPISIRAVCVGLDDSTEAGFQIRDLPVIGGELTVVEWPDQEEHETHHKVLIWDDVNHHPSTVRDFLTDTCDTDVIVAPASYDKAFWDARITATVRYLKGKRDRDAKK